MTIQFNPENELLRKCSFFVLSEIKHPDRVSRVTTTASNHEDLLDAIARSLFTPSPETAEHEKFVISNIASSIGPNDRWNINTLTGAPVDCHVGFDDGSVEVVVRIFALMDTLNGPVTGDIGSGADTLIASVLNSAQEAGNISFIGHVSPETFRTLSVLTVLNDDDASLLRLKPPGFVEGLLPDMTIDSSSQAEERTIDLLYPEGGDISVEQAADIWTEAGAVITPDESGITVRITAPINHIFNTIDATKVGFVGFKIPRK